MPDLSTVDKNSEKKTRSVLSAKITKADVPTLSAVYTLFKVPPSCLITDAYVVKPIAGQASLTADIGYAGAAELINDADLDDTTTVKDAGLKLYTGTGKDITILFSAVPTVGEFHVVVEFVELELGNGKLTNYVA